MRFLFSRIRREQNSRLLWVLAGLLILCFSSIVVGKPSSVNDAVVIRAVMQEAYTEFLNVQEGSNADYIPELAKVPSDLFGLVIVTVEGEIFAIGDSEYVFSIQSISKPFTVALVMQQHRNAEIIVEKIGVEPTGLPFNSVLAIETLPSRSGNPLVNAGAIAAVSMIAADNAEERFEKIKAFYQKMTVNPLTFLEDIYRSEAATNFGNRAMAYLLQKYGRIYAAAMETVDVYTRLCSIGVTTTQLAIMGATLANGGVNPITAERVLQAEYVPGVLALMMMAGFYDESGMWAYSVGLPSKTGVGGGIVAVVPGKMAIAGFSPRLNTAGNSVRVMKAIELITERLKLNLFYWEP